VQIGRIAPELVTATLERVAGIFSSKIAHCHLRA